MDTPTGAAKNQTVSLAFLDQFTKDLVHDVGNCLAGALSACQLLSMESALPEPCMQGLRDIESSLQRTVALVSQLGNISWQESHVASVKIDEAVQQAILSLRQKHLADVVELPDALQNCRVRAVEKILPVLLLSMATAVAATAPSKPALVFRARAEGARLCFSMSLLSRTPRPPHGLHWHLAGELARLCEGTLVWQTALAEAVLELHIAEEA